MRVITGSARGVALKTPAGMETRPTSDRVKEALFSMIQFEVEGRRVLDLFAGTGQLGIEALSRGASSAVFVDASRDAADNLCTARQACAPEVFPDEVRGVAAGIHKNSGGGAAAERFKSELARSRKKVKHPAALHFKLNHAENRFFDPVRSRTGLHARRRFQGSSSCTSRNHSHTLSRSRMKIIINRLCAAL